MNREPRGRALRALTGAVIILTASLGSVLAANIAVIDRYARYIEVGASG